MPRLRSLLACTVILAFGAAGCGDSANYAASESYAGAALQDRAAEVSYVRYYESIVDLLGNVRFQVGNMDARPLTEAVLVGDVIEVQEGRGYKVPGADAAAGRETNLADPELQWFTIHLTVNVQEVISGKVQTDVIQVGFAFSAGTSFDRLARDFLDMPSILLFLTRSEVFGYNDDLYAPVDGFLYGVIGTGERVEFPSLTSEEVNAFRAQDMTVEDLRLASAEDVTTVRIDPGTYRQHR